MLTFLAPVGLILPADSGEKMGLQITVMLTVVIYIDVLQNSKGCLNSGFIIEVNQLTFRRYVSTTIYWLE